ncbi:hypothetical protein ACX27_18910 [Nostoc piscinale CENA21]|uniref:Uncharacterized protein n=1 Tax=Nostoc piscinale CENA21 TaxID=224013 RepID=A0A0M5MHS1_9NOSO|nr:hypothetical protein ACX27_18910 [Nostoc piscinale CENA21]
MSQNPNSNKNLNSGVTFSLRLSETVLAVILTAGVSFGSGLAVAKNSNYQNQHQNVNCSVQNPVN